MIGQKLLSKVNQNLANRNQANPNEANHDQSNQVQLKLETIADDEGSITPLIVLYFIVIMASIFVIANVASMYIARKELIVTAEAALSKAAQELDETRYYYSLPSIIPPGDSRGRAIPINCNDASETFSREIAIMSFQREIEISKFECDGENLSASLNETSKLPFELPVFDTREFTNHVRVSVRSIYL
jgi:hypothetical protein